MYKSAAEQGHIGAQYELGKLYENGVFKKKIDDECLWLIEPYIDDAEYWFRPDHDEWLWLIGPNIDEAEYWYRHLQLNKMGKKVALNGAKYGVGWAKVLWDKDALAPTKPFTNDEGQKSGFQYGELMIEACHLA